jgi:hypothetical protein
MRQPGPPLLACTIDKLEPSFGYEKDTSPLKRKDFSAVRNLSKKLFDIPEVRGSILAEPRCKEGKPKQVRNSGLIWVEKR